MTEPRDNLILTLAKVIIAAAWVDGEITHEETNSLKDLLFHLPDLTGREWAMLEMYIDHPIGPSERERLVEQLKDQLRSSKEKDMVYQALEGVIAADGTVTEQEKDVVEAIQQEIEQASVGILGQMTKVIRGSINQRGEALEGAPNRENQFEDFIKNKVFYSVQRRQKNQQVELDLPEEDLRKLCLAGGLMARVAHIDQEIDPQERTAMVDVLRDKWDLTEDEAEFVSEIALSELGRDMDYYRLTRQFFMNTTEEERVEFLATLFGIAAADGHVTHNEIEEIRAVSKSLRATHRQFIEAKLTIPSELRAG